MTVNSFTPIARQIESMFSTPQQIKSFVGSDMLFICSHARSDRIWGTAGHQFIWHRGGGVGSFSGLQLTTRQPSNSEIMSEWRCTFTLPNPFTETNLSLTYIETAWSTPARLVSICISVFLSISTYLCQTKKNPIFTKVRLWGFVLVTDPRVPNI